MFESSVFSDKICQLCCNDLEVFSQLRKDLSNKQNCLYRAAEKQPEIASRIFKVKSENNEFIDCNPTLNIEEIEEDLYNPEVTIKSEDNEIEALDDALLYEETEINKTL